MGLLASTMDAGTFYHAAKRAGLGTDNDTLNKIVRGVNEGLSPDEAAQQAKGNRRMGLLDMFGSSMDDPKTIGILQLAASLSNARRPMQGLQQGLLAYQGTLSQAKKEEEAKQLRALQLQQAQLQFQQTQAEAEKQKRLRELASQFAQTPTQVAMAQNGGPTVAAAQAIPTTKPGFDFAGYANALAGVDPVASLNMQAALRKDKPTPVALGRDQRLVDPITGRSLVDAMPEKQDEFTRRMIQAGIDPASPEGQQMARQYLTKQTTHSPAVNVTYGSPVAGIDPRTGQGVFFQPSKDGKAPAIVPGVVPPKAEKPLTEAQAKAAAFASQMRSAEAELSDSGFNASSLASQVEVAAAGGLGNLIAGKQAQRARQSQEQWAEAFLRFKTGAASTEDEVRRNVRTYFPQPGDSPEVIKQKERMRLQAMRDVEINAGNPQSVIRNAPAPLASGGWSITPVGN